MNSEILNEYLHYNRYLGIFYWLKKPSKRIAAGSRAGSYNNLGYYQITLKGRNYLGHQLAWLAHYGEWPQENIDHRDGDPSNNRIDNLRLATHNVNMQNKRGAMSNSKTGYLGVHKRTDRDHYLATIMVNKKAIYLGSAKTPEEAYELYLAAKRKLHEGNTL